MSLRIEWRVRDSLLSYLERAPDFSVETTGGAAFVSGEGVTFPAVVGDAGELAATGAVTFRAHGGMLTIPLRGVRLDGEGLSIRDPLGDDDAAPEAAVPMRRLLLVPGVQLPVLEGEYVAELAPESDAMFLYNYVPRAPFGVVHVVRG